MIGMILGIEKILRIGMIQMNWGGSGRDDWSGKWSGEAVGVLAARLDGGLQGFWMADFAARFVLESELKFFPARFYIKIFYGGAPMGARRRRHRDGTRSKRPGSLRNRLEYRSPRACPSCFLWI
jgi:hypothetical protein